MNKTEFTHDSIHLAFYDNEMMRILNRIWECDDSIELFELLDDADYADSVRTIRYAYVKAAKEIAWTAEAQGIISFDDWSVINSRLSWIGVADEEDPECLD